MLLRCKPEDAVMRTPCVLRIASICGRASAVVLARIRFWLGGQDELARTRLGDLAHG